MVAVHTSQLLAIMIPITLLLFFRLLLRRTDLAVGAVSLIAIVMFYGGTGGFSGYLLAVCLVAALAWTVCSASVCSPSRSR
jgi:hypothetical protein